MKKLIVALCLTVVLLVAFAAPALAGGPPASVPPQAADMGIGTAKAAVDAAGAPDMIPDVESIPVPVTPPGPPF